VVSIAAHFAEMKVPTTIYRTTKTKVNGVITPTEATVGTAAGVFFEGGSSRSNRNERIRSEIVATVVYDPADLGSVAVLDGDRIAVTRAAGTVSYLAIHGDDVAEMGEVVEVPLKAMT
jgi:hypothetical protein